MFELESTSGAKSSVSIATASTRFDATLARGWGRLRGLIGSHEPSPLLLRTRQVHTFGMKYPIDAAYIDGKGTVIRVARLQPKRLGPFILRARWILEMRSGEAERLGVVAGSRIEIDESAGR